MQFARKIEGLTPDFIPSRLFIYYNERVIQGTVNTDSGATISDAFKVLSTLGAPPETDWPYDVTQFAVQPTAQAFTDGKLDLAIQYLSVSQDLTSIKSAIYQNQPVVFG